RMHQSQILEVLLDPACTKSKCDKATILNTNREINQAGLPKFSPLGQACFTAGGAMGFSRLLIHGPNYITQCRETLSILLTPGAKRCDGSVSTTQKSTSKTSAFSLAAQLASGQLYVLKALLACAVDDGRLQIDPNTELEDWIRAVVMSCSDECRSMFDELLRIN